MQKKTQKLSRFFKILNVEIINDIENNRYYKKYVTKKNDDLA